MTKLILIDAQKMEKLLLKLGSGKSGRRGAMSFTNILMEGIPQFPIIKEGLGSSIDKREILKEIEISIDEYNKYLKKI